MRTYQNRQPTGKAEYRSSIGIGNSTVTRNFRPTVLIIQHIPAQTRILEKEEK
jgi:hypothetical protein